MNESIIYNLIIVVHGIKFTLEIISVYYKRDFFLITYFKGIRF